MVLYSEKDVESAFLCYYAKENGLKYSTMSAASQKISKVVGLVFLAIVISAAFGKLSTSTFGAILIGVSVANLSFALLTSDGIFKKNKIFFIFNLFSIFLPAILGIVQLTGVLPVTAVATLWFQIALPINILFMIIITRQGLKSRRHFKEKNFDSAPNNDRGFILPMPFNIPSLQERFVMNNDLSIEDKKELNRIFLKAGLRVTPLETNPQ
ncbi:MAG: hypothetical protein R3E91_05695 [Chlamydiales bacterium]